MSGIFKGDSIYKSGGGGGGYKDGGQLVDGDFIKVENNTVSSYDNVSRDPVNFYFEVNDGESLNSVVELTTAVNATINVYVVKNGFYYLLGNVGGNTVNAGDDYNLTVVGNSFILEVVTPSSNDPEAVIIDGHIYKLTKVNNLLWTSYLGIDTPYTADKTSFGRLNTLDVPDIRMYKNDNPGQFTQYLKNGLRLPTYTDYVDLLYNSGFSSSDLRSNFGWSSIPNGNNSSGLNFIPFGYVSGGGYPNWPGKYSTDSFWPRLNGNENAFSLGDWYINNTDKTVCWTIWGGFTAVRFVIDV